MLDFSLIQSLLVPPQSYSDDLFNYLQSVSQWPRLFIRERSLTFRNHQNGAQENRLLWYRLFLFSRSLLSYERIARSVSVYLYSYIGVIYAYSAIYLHPA